MDFYLEVLTNEFSDEISEFMKKEWHTSNLENFGREIDEGEWKHPITVLAYLKPDPKNIAGVAKCNVVGNTLRVSQLLVKTEFRKSHGIGTLIMEKLEELSRKNSWHKIRLSTSENHQNLDFYLKLGFEIEATLRNDAFGSQWYILSKFL